MGRERRSSGPFLSFFTFLMLLVISARAASSPSPSAPLPIADECDCKDRTAITIHLFLPIDPFAPSQDALYALRTGFLEATKRSKVRSQLHYPSATDFVDLYFSNQTIAMTGLLHTFLQGQEGREDEGKTDSLLVYYIAGVDDRVAALRERGYRVFTLGGVPSDMSHSRALHIGMDDYEAGRLLGESFVHKKCSSKTICFQDSTHSASRMRCQGFMDAIAASGPEESPKVVVLDGLSVDEMKRKLEAGLPGASGVFIQSLQSLNLQSWTEVLRAFRGQGSTLFSPSSSPSSSLSTPPKSSSCVGSVGHTRNGELLLREGLLDVLYTDQPYLQGFLSLFLMTYYHTTGMKPRNINSTLHAGPRPSYPGTEAESDEKGSGQRQGKGGEMAGKWTKESVRYRFLTHGNGADSFWASYKNATLTAVEDIGLPFTDCTSLSLSPSSLSSSLSSSTFPSLSNNGASCTSASTDSFRYIYGVGHNAELELMGPHLQRFIEENASAVILSIPSFTALNASLQALSRSGIPFFTVNAGDKLESAMGIKPIHYIGQVETYAGLQAGRMMKNITKGDALCLLFPDQVNQQERCDGFERGLGRTVHRLSSSYDGNIVQQNLLSFLSSQSSLSSDNSSTNVSVESILATSGAVSLSVLHSLSVWGTFSQYKVGTFDNMPKLRSSLQEKELFFSIDQQQGLQAYSSVILAHLYAMTGQRLVDDSIFTGPAFMLQSDSIQELACQYERTCASIGLAASLSSPHTSSASPTVASSASVLPSATGTTSCRKDWIGDGWCDEENNKKECQWDGGDCCEHSCKSSSFLCGTDYFQTLYNAYDCKKPLCTAGQRPAEREGGGGEISCEICPKYTFGVDGRNCIVCVNNVLSRRVQCMGGETLRPAVGFWIDRQSLKEELGDGQSSNSSFPPSQDYYEEILSRHVYQCHPNWCTGQASDADDLLLGYTASGCIKGTLESSPLCMACDELHGYRKMGVECQEHEVCSDVGRPYIFVAFVVGGLFLSFYVFTFQLRKDRIRDNAKVSILLFFLQVQLSFSSAVPSASEEGALRFLRLIMLDLPQIVIKDKGCSPFGYGTLVVHLGLRSLCVLYFLLVILFTCGLYAVKEGRKVQRWRRTPHSERKNTLIALLLSVPLEGRVRDKLLLKTAQIHIYVLFYLLFLPAFRMASQLSTCIKIGKEKVLLADASLDCSDYPLALGLGYTVWVLLCFFLLLLSLALYAIRTLSEKEEKKRTKQREKEATRTGKEKIQKEMSEFPGSDPWTRRRKVWRALLAPLTHDYRPGMEGWVGWKVGQQAIMGYALDCLWQVERKILVLWGLWLFSVFLQIAAQPYKERMHNLLETLSCFLCFLSVNHFLFFKTGVSSLSWISIVMSTSLIFLIVILLAAIWSFLSLYDRPLSPRSVHPDGGQSQQQDTVYIPGPPCSQLDPLQPPTTSLPSFSLLRPSAATVDRDATDDREGKTTSEIRRERDLAEEVHAAHARRGSAERLKRGEERGEAREIGNDQRPSKLVKREDPGRRSSSQETAGGPDDLKKALAQVMREASGNVGVQLPNPSSNAERRSSSRRLTS